VKKIKLRTSQSDNKIFREVNALSRLSHRFIVRYYTTWLEETESTSNASSDSEHDDLDPLGEKTAGGALQITRTISTDTDSFQDPRIFDLNDLVLEDSGQTTKSFPSIHFTSGDVASDDSDEEDVSSMRMTERMQREKVEKQPVQHFTERTLYIQMVSDDFPSIRCTSPIFFIGIRSKPDS
jgi:eukaryotic translation initiation factor 2-alpha kinase 4